MAQQFRLSRLAQYLASSLSPSEQRPLMEHMTAQLQTLLARLFADLYHRALLAATRKGDRLPPELDTDAELAATTAAGAPFLRQPLGVHLLPGGACVLRNPTAALTRCLAGVHQARVFVLQHILHRYRAVAAASNRPFAPVIYLPRGSPLFQYQERVRSLAACQMLECTSLARSCAGS